MIRVHGPNWSTVNALRKALRSVPEEGSFTFGGSKYNATEQLERFRSNGVRTVESTNSVTTAKAWVRNGYTVFARRERHTRGSDIRVASLYQAPSRVWLRRDWWTKYIPSVGEWRIHIFNGASIARGKKTWSGSSNQYRGIEPSVIAIRSRRNGWHLDHTQRPPDGIRDAAKRAVAALPGYLYGAVDILETAADGPIVLEVNLLPAMDDYTRGKYVEAIRAYVRSNPTARPTFYEGYEIV
jgi:hypothetical protein